MRKGDGTLLAVAGITGGKDATFRKGMKQRMKSVKRTGRKRNQGGKRLIFSGYTA